MNIESYNKVINAIKQTEDPNTPRKKKSRGGFDRAELAFKKDLLRGKIVWTNNKKKDWKYYVNLNHPALSICKVPKQHPFGRLERFCAFMIDFGLSAVFAYIVNLMTRGFCEEDEEDWDWESDSSNNCPGTFEFPPLEVFLYGQAYSFGFAIINAISNGFVKQCATCGCCQKDSCPKCCRKCTECIGDILLFFWLLVVLALCGLFGYGAWINNQFTEFMLNFAGNRLWSWVTCFILMRICFLRKWKKEKANKGKVLNKFKVTYIEYELYVNGKQVEIPPDYRPSRSNTIGSVGSNEEAAYVGRTMTINSASPTPTTPHSTQTIYVDQNGNQVQMVPVSQPQIAYVQSPPSVVSSVVYK